MNRLRSIPAQVNLSVTKRRWLQSQLIDWYYGSRRDLPWRGIQDPYKVWISEVMLQQTQVKTVIPYYEKFLRAFPDLASLANARVDRLVKCWAGLGYYSRARNLKKAAQLIMSEHQGKFPETFEEVHDLPGIGKYTAAAIMSICFSKPLAVLDGNVVRILTRVLRIHGSVKEGKVQRKLWQLAQHLLVRRNAGDFNQALMDLGATVCTPRQPRCSLCPWEEKCLARKEGIQELLPEKGKRPPSTESHRAAIILSSRGKYLIVRRSEKGQLHGFWEFPTFELRGEQSASLVLANLFHRNYGLRFSELKRVSQIRHSITSKRINLDVFQGRIRKTGKEIDLGVDFRWVKPEELSRYPFSAATLRILDALSLAR